MNTINIKTKFSLVLAVLICLLQGCDLNVRVIGDGYVTSESGNITCEDNCTYKGSPNRANEDILYHHANEGSEFIGWVDTSTWVQHGESFEVIWGTLIGGSAIPIGPAGGKVLAVFKPLEPGVQSYASLDRVLCVLENDGVVTCHGFKEYNHITDAHYVAHKVPEAVVDVVQLESGYMHFCALTQDDVHCWGDNLYGQLDVPALSNPVEISLSPYASCAVDDTGEVCWGDLDAE